MMKQWVLLNGNENNTYHLGMYCQMNEVIKEMNSCEKSLAY